MSSFDYDSAFSSSATSSGTDATTAELQTFVQTMQQRASFQSRVNHLTSLCWEKCVSGYPPGKLDGKKSTCLENCAERYLDVSILLRTRFQAMLSKLQQ
ncbi:Mitochondrial inner membrane translocase [Paragonimus heterotremus]|uniref:Mitochondrial import inner membrane translocase subunit n=1 Tax=Paragonimus heterotremus TaxID=100268 RepID=A0A8J4T4F5_9TREM|nr:Mitochondrial inner membrane translocase [Paragonimus heterotremus]